MNRTHGQYNSHLNSIWRAMRNRCNNPRNAHYHQYGGRGITVDSRWDSFANFAADMGEPPSPKHTLDRENNDGPYCKENCRWATRQEQSNNTRQNRLIPFNGELISVSEAARRSGIKRVTINARLRAGKSGEELFYAC